MEIYPKVAILVLNYNGSDCLPACLRSLEALGYPNYQVVVIDNGSTDDSFDNAKALFPEFHYIQKESNTGFAKGMNTGMRYAEQAGFDMCWLMNYDALVQKDTLAVLIRAWQLQPEMVAMSPVIEDMSGKCWFAGGSINFWRMRTEHQQRVLRNHPYETSFLTGCAPLFTLDLLKNVGFFDERFFLYYEDADLSVRIQKAGYPLHVIPQAVVAHAEKSNASDGKLFYLVSSGLLFFALHTPVMLRPYIVAYVTIRRLVNQIKLLFGLSGAKTVAKAYADYFEKFQAGYQLYLRKLS